MTKRGKSDRRASLSVTLSPEGVLRRYARISGMGLTLLAGGTLWAPAHAAGAPPPAGAPVFGSPAWFAQSRSIPPTGTSSTARTGQVLTPSGRPFNLQSLVATSMTNMERAASALAAQQAAQAGAHQAALAAASTVPDGLTAGGLVVDPRVVAGTDPNLWVNASRPTQTTSNGQTTVTIDQTGQRAVLTWESFNVGKNTTVDFNQAAGNSANGNNWVALNRIDASGNPAQIFGHIKAQGEVLLIDPNGIIFNGSSQVNVHSLIAAASDINGFSLNSNGVNFNVGAFSASGDAYVPVVVNSVTQAGASGTTLFAPSSEDNANVQFETGGLFASGLSNPTLVLSAGALPNQASAGITVQRGASINTDISGFDNGGFVALVGPSVTNSGTITTGSGQIILAAEPNVFISQPSNGAGTTLSVLPFSSTSGYGPTLVYGGAALSGPGVVGNEGLLVSNDGAITLVGSQVNQLGVAEATTSVTRAGSFNIYADTQLSFGGNSVTAILPDENGETVPSNSVSAFVGPSININAGNIELHGDSNSAPGALIVAPSAAMNVATSAFAPPSGSEIFPAGRFLMDSGSVIDLAGLDATASAANYLYTFKVTANDIADSPLAKSLIGQAVTIDLRLSGTRSDGSTWVGSPLFSASGSGYLGDIAQNIDLLLTKGGALTFQGLGTYLPFSDVLQQTGSIINISGGSVAYKGANINTTNLLAANGQVYNIGTADPMQIYVGLAGNYAESHPRWGVTQTYTNPLLDAAYYQPGYTDGISAGSLSVSAVNPVLEGTLFGSVQIGTRQALLAESGTGANGAQAIPDQLPQGAALSITTVAAQSGFSSNAILLQSKSGDILGPNFGFGSQLKLPTITVPFQISPSGGPVESETLSELVYSTDILSAAGFGSIAFNSSSFVSEAKGAVLSVRPGGSIKLGGVSTIDGALIAPAGKISLTGFTGGTFMFDVPPSPKLTIGPDAMLDVAGLWVNDAGATDNTIRGPAYINGGSINIQTYIESTATSGTYGNNSLGQYVPLAPVVDTTQSIVLAPGSVVDLSSGGYVGVNGKLKTGANGLPVGDGGSLSLLTYQSNSGNGSSGWQYEYLGSGVGISQPGNFAPDFGNEPNQANIFLNGVIYSGGLTKGGMLTLQAPVIQIGGVSKLTDYTSGAQAGTLALPASFFSSNGFSNYSLTSTYGGVTVTAGTQVLLQQQNYLLDDIGTLSATGTSLRSFATLGLAPLGQRGPVNLSLTQSAYAEAFASPFNPSPDNTSLNAGILVENGAAILGDPGAQITLMANGPVTVLGRLSAPGGGIALTNNGVPENVSQVIANGGAPQGNTSAPQDIWIGSDAVLDVSGAFVPNPLVTAYRTGSVLPGGSISLLGGTVIAMPGSMFDIAGASATVQTPSPSAGLGGPLTRSQAIWSDGGSLTIGPSPSAIDTGVQVQGVYQTAYFDGLIRAEGGGLGSGGTLTITGADYYAPNLYSSAIVVMPSGPVTGALDASAMNTPGAAYPTSAAQLAALLPTVNGNIQNYDYVSAKTINNSGLGSVSLNADTIAFSGNTTVKLPGTLALGGVVTLLPAGSTDPSYTAASIGAPTVNLDAGYISLSNFVGVYETSSASGQYTGSVSAPNLSDGTINLNASAQIDLVGRNVGGAGLIPIAIDNAANVNFSSGGDIRLLGQFLYSVTSSQSQSPIAQAPGFIEVPDNLTLTAREVYAATDTTFLLQSLGLGTGGGTVNTITVAPNGAKPVTPYSVDGAILVDASKIVQAGALYAPLGSIQFGLNSGQSLPAPWDQASASAVATSAVTLAPGSLTSVSLGGLDLPYGTTVNDINWTAANSTLALVAPPTKSIALNGASIDSASGSIVDVAGGGDIYATEFVPGTGGSRNVLTSAASGQAVYALVPSYEAPVAPTDLTYGQTIVPGSAVSLAGGDGIVAGTYTLLPAIYATLPGALRAVVVSANVNPATPTSVAPDGSVYTTGTLTNVITGTKTSNATLIEIQSDSVWSRYSQVDLTSANTYFPKLAASTGAVTPQLPIDGGDLVVSAANALTLNGTDHFTPATGGRGGSAAVTGSNLLVLAPDQTESDADAQVGYLVLNSDQLSALGATTLLLGGTSTLAGSGLTLNATANNLEVQTDAAHPLTGPDVLLVTAGQAGANGLTVDAGSVIAAAGTVLAGNDVNILLNGGSLLRVSNGAPVMTTISNPSEAAGATLAIGTQPGTSSLSTQPGAAATINGSVALALDTAGNSILAPNAVLQAQNFELEGGVINLGAVPADTAGLTLSPQVIADFAGAKSVALRSQSVINLYDASGLKLGDAANPVGTLTLDGAGLYSAGGTTTIAANNIDLIDSQATPSTAGALSASGGSLNLNAVGTVTLGVGGKTLGNFSTINLTAGHEIVFAGSGSLDAGAGTVTMIAPDVRTAAGAAQALSATGALVIQPGTGTAPAVDATDIGGVLRLTGGSIADSGAITTLGGQLTLAATNGDVVLNSGAKINAGGSHIVLFDATEDVPGSTVKLVANNGNVIIDSGSTIDVAATGNGYAGSLTVTTAPTGSVALDGTLSGGAAYNDLGGRFSITAGSLTGGLPFSSGFTGGFSVALGSGDIVVPAGTALTSSDVLLSTNTGGVVVNGIIDANGPSGGSIQLYGGGTGTAAAGTAGASGVTLGSTAQLLAFYKADDSKDPAHGNGESALVQNGGTITLGVTGAADGSTNATYGYENIDGSGAITVAPGAILNVSGGAGGNNISNNGGAIILRAPILTSGNVNVSFQGDVITSANGGPAGQGLVLDAYAVWSTKDGSSGGKHFDGIIDPAGWFSDSGNPLEGTDQGGSPLTAPTPLNPLQPGQFFAPTTANPDHVGFYQTTLVDFVQSPFDVAAVGGDFAGAMGLTLGSTLHLQPGITLVNPSGSINGGNITVASNWNLGAGTESSTGVPTLYYRTANSTDPGEPGTLDLRAANNVQINATLSDGFFHTYQAVALPTIIPGTTVTGASFVPPSLSSPATAAQAAAAAAAASDAIANNPGLDGVLNPQYNTTSSSDLMASGFAGSTGSFSYNFVGGAAFGSGNIISANPNAVISLPSGAVTSGPNPRDSVTVNGHTSYLSGNLAVLLYGYPPAYQTIDIPTLVRTGTGSITITAAGSFELLDTMAPGAVYTAGTAAPLAANYTAPVLQTGGGDVANGLVTAPAWGTNGGGVTVNVGDSIIGIEAPVDDANGSQTLVAGGPTGEFWTAWYYRAGLSSGEPLTPFDVAYSDPNYVNNIYLNLPARQNAAWINYGTFFQGIGALGGGNVTLRADGNISDISASLPETVQVSGGQYLGDPAAAAHYYGGGDLVVRAGGNLYSSTFYVGRGTGSITVGGTVATDPLNPITGTATTYSDVGFSGQLRQPNSLPLLLAVQDGFISVTAARSVSLGGVFDPSELPQNLGPLAASDGYSITLPDLGATFQSYGPNSGIALASLAGDVSLNTLAGFNTGGTTLFNPNWTGAYVPPVEVRSTVAPAVLDVAALTGNINLASNLSQVAAPTGTINFLAGGSIADDSVGVRYGNPYSSIYNLTMLDGTNPPAPSLLGLPTPAILAASVHANDPAPVILYAGGDITGGFTFVKPAKIEAGGDIVNTTFVGQNNNPGDITSVIAGGSILAAQTLIPGQPPIDNTSNFQLYGPGTFLIQAGKNLGPFFTNLGNPGGGGIEAVGDGSNLGSAYVKSYLPVRGANIYALFGVGPGIDYQAAIDSYVNPVSAGARGIDYLTSIASALGQSPDQAWTTFQGLPAVQQQLLIDQAFLRFLSQVGLDYNNPASPYFGQYARAYQTIATLFPAADGYTDNAPTGVNGAANRVATGDFNMAHSLLETQTGGDIYILGPGGNLNVGANATDNSTPSQEGILTLQGGSILTYTDGSVIVDQSRIFTEQGGDIDMFTANGDLNAGKGPKSSAAYPPLSLIWDVDGYTRVNPAGLVTGAGIGALLSVPGQDPALSNTNLVAPRGTVDAGAAGIRVAGNLNIAALQVLNAFNIQVGGRAVGVPAPPHIDSGALAAASVAGAAAAQVAGGSDNAGSNLDTVVTVKVLGFGEPEEEQKEKLRRSLKHR